jgi:uncharacterized protein
MRISETIRTFVVLAALSFGGQTALAFELKDGVPVETSPDRAQNLVPLTGPALPTLGVDRTLKEMWQGFQKSYRSGDKHSALRQLELAAERGDILAQWKLGRMYADGDGVDADDYKAFRMFSRIADARADESRDSLHAGVVANAFVALGHYWHGGIAQSPVKANPARAAKAFSYAATYYGHPEAQFQLARMMLDGSASGKPEPRSAMGWLNLSAEKGHGLAQASLGRMLLVGEAVARQPVRGLMWLILARSSAAAASNAWIIELHDKAMEAASDDVKRQAQAMADRFSTRSVAAERR